MNSLQTPIDPISIIVAYFCLAWDVYCFQHNPSRILIALMLIDVYRLLSDTCQDIPVVAILWISLQFLSYIRILNPYLRNA